MEPPQLIAALSCRGAAFSASLAAGQFSLLICVVVLSAIIPTAIAQRWFSPDVEAERTGDQQAKPKPTSRSAPDRRPAPEAARS